MADRRKADPLCGVVSKICNGYCFIRNTDWCSSNGSLSSSNGSRNTFRQLPDGFTHKTCFNRAEWSSLSLYQSVGYFAEVVKRAHSGDIKMHVTSAWLVDEEQDGTRTRRWVVDEEEEVEEDEDGGVDGKEEEDVGEEDEDDEVYLRRFERSQSAAVTAPWKRRRLNADDGPDFTGC